MNAAPLCSVIIPCYKAAEHVRFALESVPRQTHPAWEVIAVEDGVADGTEEIVGEFQAKFGPDRFRFVRHPQNLGLSEARNTGMRAARGEVYAFLDHDDVWNPNHLEALTAAMAKSGAQMAFCCTRRFQDETGQELERYGPSPEEWERFPASLFVRNYIAPSTVAIRKEVFEKVGPFYPGLKSCEDHDYWLRVVRAGGKVAFVDAENIRYRMRRGQMTNNRLKMHAGAALVAQRHWRMREVPLGVRLRHASEIFEQLSFTYLREGQARAAAKTLVQGWLFNPWRVRFLVRAARWSLSGKHA